MAKSRRVTPPSPGKISFPPAPMLFVINNILEVKVGVDVEFLRREQNADVSWISLQKVHFGELGAGGVSCKCNFHFSLRCFGYSAKFPSYVFFTIS